MSKLSLDHLKYVFTVLLAGQILSTVTFGLEIFVARITAGRKRKRSLNIRSNFELKMGPDI